MEQRVSLVTLGVDDLPRARAFYEALGWRGVEVQQTVFFAAGGVVVVLWSRAALAADSGLPVEAPRGVSVVLAHNVRSPEEVDAVLAAAAAAGGRVTRPPGPTSYGGHAGVFVDPDGHAWEVAHNPGFGLSDAGAVVLPAELLPLDPRADGAERA